MESVIGVRPQVPDWVKAGYGYGDGYGDGSYWLACLPYFARKWTEPQRARLSELQKLGITIAFWRSDSDGRACNGGDSKRIAAAGLVEEVAGPLKICSRHALHATRVPPKWQGERVWVVALFGEIQEQEDKLGALKREILGEAL